MKLFKVVVVSFILATVLTYLFPFITNMFTMQDLNGIFQLASFIILIFVLKGVYDQK